MSHPFAFNPLLARRHAAAVAVAAATRAARHAAMAGDADALDDHLADLAAPSRGHALRRRRDEGARAALARLARTHATLASEMPA